MPPHLNSPDGLPALSTYVPTYLPTSYLRTFLSWPCDKLAYLACLSTLLTYLLWPRHQITCLPTYLPNYLPWPRDQLAYLPTNPPTYLSSLAA